MRMRRKARRLRFTVEVGLKRPFTSIGARDGRREAMLGLDAKARP
jgi:hypothetical protein